MNIYMHEMCQINFRVFYLKIIVNTLHLRLSLTKTIMNFWNVSPSNHI